MADGFKNFLDLLNEAGMIDWLCQLDVAKMALAFRHVLLASLALELSVYGAETRVVETILARLGAGFVHGLGVENVRDTVVFDLLR